MDDRCLSFIYPLWHPRSHLHQAHPQGLSIPPSHLCSFSNKPFLLFPWFLLERFLLLFLYIVFQNNDLRTPLHVTAG